MSDSRLKRLLKYCPRPGKPLTTSLKRYFPLTLLVSFSIAALLAVSPFLNLPTQSVTPPPPPTVTGKYNPGLAVGDYVVYGNFVCNVGKGWTDLAFWKAEVIAVSGKEVTFLHTEQFKNGTAAWFDGRTETWDVELGVWSEDSDDYVCPFLIIAANLTEGDCYSLSEVPIGETSLPEFYIAETEVRTYLGVNRSVAVLHLRDTLNESHPEIGQIIVNHVYDQVSGIMLEQVDTSLDGDVLGSYSVVETNIFSTPNANLSSVQEDKAAETPTVALYATTGLIIIAISVGVVVLLRRKWSRGGEEYKKSRAD